MAAQPRISPRQLDAFCTFMEAGTVTAAAVRLRISQSAVSKILRGLEEQVGCVLFLRESRRLIPTREAQLLRREVDRIFQGLDGVDGFIRNLRNLEEGELEILATPALGEAFLFDVLADFAQNRGNVRASFQLRHSHVVNQRIADQQSDLGFSMLPFDHPGVIGEDLFHVPAVCVLPVGHRLAAAPLVRAQDLRGETFLSFSRDARMRHLVDAVFEQQHIVRRLQHEIYSSFEACALAARGLGVAIVDPLTARQAEPSVVVVPFEPRIDYTFKAMRPRFRESSRLAEAFLDAVRTKVSEMAASDAIAGMRCPD
ncbi:MAG: LysR substrate-binding domain-containing protein [Pseudomonadota bacterium]